ncbi:UNVERIFIED_ORG: hypothetical protein FHU01_1543 [Citrobacter freundii]|jgi:hypothetical protein
MKKISLCCLCVLALSGCTVQKQMTPVSGSKADGTIRMGYHVGDSYGAFEKANVDIIFAFRRYDRGIREVHCTSTPVTSSVCRVCKKLLASVFFQRVILHVYHVKYNVA